MTVSAEIALVAVLILLNGFFAMAEMSLVSSRRSRLRELAARRVRGASSALRLAEDPGSFLSTVQIGITLIGILAGAISGATLADHLARYLNAIDLVRPYGGPVAIALVVTSITFCSLIIGELVPKRIALANAELIAARVAPVMLVVSRVTRPVVAILQGATRLVLTALRVSATPRDAVSESEVRALIREGAEAGVFAPTEHQMVSEVMRLDSRAVTTIMTPRHEVIWIRIGADRAEIARVLAGTNHSRFPVCDGPFENVVGVISTKRLLEQTLRNEPLDIRRIMREPIIVPETARALEVLQLFKARRPHMAVVVDEHASVQGIVTPSDILETIAGDFADGDSEAPAIVERRDGGWLVDGQVELVELEERIGLAVAGDDPYRSLAAYVLDEMQRLPEAGATFDRGAWRFEIVDMDGRRIDKVLIRRRGEGDGGDPSIRYG